MFVLISGDEKSQVYIIYIYLAFLAIFSRPKCYSVMVCAV